MKDFIYWILVCLFIPLTVVAENEQIYKPIVIENGLNDLEDVKTRQGMLGIGYANVLPENTVTSHRALINAKYLAGENWYWTGEFQTGVNNSSELVVDNVVYREKDEAVTRYGLGAGYAFLHGNASFSGKITMPWQMTAELLVGQQQTAQTSGQYASMGLSTQLLGKRFWGALSLRQFNVGDERLKTLGSNWGTQWDILFGFWF